MTTGRNISIRGWRMNRLPFVIYLGGIACSTLGIATYVIAAYDSYFKYPAGVVAIGGVLLFLALPFALSMRIRDAGFHPAWGLWPFAGLFVMTWIIFRALGSFGASIGGSPGGTEVTLTQWEILANNLTYYFLIINLIYLGILSLFGVFAPTKIDSEPNGDFRD